MQLLLKPQLTCTTNGINWNTSVFDYSFSYWLPHILWKFISTCSIKLIAFACVYVCV